MATLLRNLSRSLSNTSCFKHKDAQEVGETSPNDFLTNGFRLELEKQALKLDDANVAPFSLPQEILTWNPEGLVVHVYSNGDRERKIYCNVELGEEEAANLRKMQKEAERQGVAFMPSVSVAALRFLADKRAGGDVLKAIDFMRRTQEWRLSYFQQPLDPSSDPELRADLQRGIVYWAGRDSSLRPTLVFRAKRVPADWHKHGRIGRIVKLFIFCIEYGLRYMLFPGRVENFNVIVDLAGIGLMQVPVSALKELQKSMGSYYCGRLFKFYVCNMSWTLRSLVSVAKTVLSERQMLKLHFVKDVAELRQHFALHQLEADLGGSRAELQDVFFPWALQPGPFEAGHAAGPGTDRVPHVHRVLTLAGSRGKLWDSACGAVQNTEHEYSEVAADIFRSCNLPVPLRGQAAGKTGAQEPAIAENREPTASWAASEESEAVNVIATPSSMEGGQEDRLPESPRDVLVVDLHDISVHPQGFCGFSCKVFAPLSYKASL